MWLRHLVEYGALLNTKENALLRFTSSDKKMIFQIVVYIIPIMPTPSLRLIKSPIPTPSPYKMILNKSPSMSKSPERTLPPLSLKVSPSYSPSKTPYPSLSPSSTPSLSSSPSPSPTPLSIFTINETKILIIVVLFVAFIFRTVISKIIKKNKPKVKLDYPSNSPRNLYSVDFKSNQFNQQINPTAYNRLNLIRRSGSSTSLTNSGDVTPVPSNLNFQ